MLYNVLHMPGNSPKLPDQTPAGNLLDAYRRQRLELERDRNILGLFVQLPGAESDPELNALADTVEARTVVLQSVAALVRDPTDSSDRYLN